MIPPHRPSVLDTPITRREAVRRTTLGAIAIAAGGCVRPTSVEGVGTGRLTARVVAPTTTTTPGTYPIGLTSGRDGLLYVPTSYNPDTAAPIALLLHGAGGQASELVTPMRPFADATGLVLLAPDSRGITWDGIDDYLVDDVEYIDRALESAFARIRVDASRVRIIGFSDGATYSLSLGIINGDLFSRVVAFSPGYIVKRTSTGKPKFFITHGTRDAVLPIGQTSRRIVSDLRASGYDVEYIEFDGGHTVTAPLMEQAVTWAAS